MENRTKFYLDFLVSVIILQTANYDDFEDVSRERERKSPVWLYFLMSKRQERVKCRYCNTTYLFKGHGSTSILFKHLLSVHNIDVKNPDSNTQFLG